MGGSLTRRQFLGRAAGTVTVALPRGAWQPAPALATVVLDLKEHCSLGESLTGYESALASSGTRCLRDDGRGVPRCAALIVPAAVRIAAPALRAMVTALEAGATVILESGAAFAAEPDFRCHRDVLRDFLGVRIEPPVRLWPRPAHARPGGMPYVDYTWPHPAKLRDFSRVVPLGCDHGEEAEFIGWVDGLPVALKCRRERGTLVFLGSPLGPALWAGEREARRWFLGAHAKARAAGNGTSPAN